MKTEISLICGMRILTLLPGDIDCHVLLGCASEHPEQLVEGGGQELDHHVTLHGVQTLRLTDDNCA